MIKVGEHITLDIIGTTKEYDPSVYEKVIYKIDKAANVTILNISKYGLVLCHRMVNSIPSEQPKERL